MDEPTKKNPKRWYCVGDDSRSLGIGSKDDLRAQGKRMHDTPPPPPKYPEGPLQHREQRLRDKTEKQYKTGAKCKLSDGPGYPVHPDGRALTIEERFEEASNRRLTRLRELWPQAQPNQLEIGKLLYEERKDRISVGGRGHNDGFHEWLRQAGLSKASAYRRIAEYEISIGKREDPLSKPVSLETTSVDFEAFDPVAEVVIRSDGITERVGGWSNHRVRDVHPPGFDPEVASPEPLERLTAATERLYQAAQHYGFGRTQPCVIKERHSFSRWSDFGPLEYNFTVKFSVKNEAEAQKLIAMWSLNREEDNLDDTIVTRQEPTEEKQAEDRQGSREGEGTASRD